MLSFDKLGKDNKNSKLLSFSFASFKTIDFKEKRFIVK